MHSLHYTEIEYNKRLFFLIIYIGQDRCYDPIGIQSHRIPDSSFSASSELASNTPASAAKLYWTGNGIQDGAWCADDRDQVLIIYQNELFYLIS